MKLCQRFYLFSFFSLLVLITLSSQAYCFQIDFGRSLSEQNESELTKLLDASHDGDFDLVKSLSQSKKFRQYLQSPPGPTPLILACNGGHVDIVELLLDTDSSLENLLATRNAVTALISASVGGHLEVVKLLVSATRPSFRQLLIFSTSGPTALIAACESGNFDVVNFLLETDPSLELLLARDGEGRTALMRMSLKRKPKMVQLLLDHNSSLDHLLARDYEGRTALAWAFRRQFKEIMSLFKNINIQPSAMKYFQAERGLLIDSGRSLSEQNKSTWKKLLDASRDGDFKVVKSLSQSENFRQYLLEKSPQGPTPLILACKGGHVDIVELLLNTDSSLEHLLATHNAVTALVSACVGGHLEVVKLLVRATKPSWQQFLISFSTSGPTALMAACESGNYALVNFLLETDASLELLLARNWEGRTALMQMSHRKDPKMVQLLLYHNSSPYHLLAKDYEGLTALAWASQYHVKEIVSILEHAQSKIQPRATKRFHCGAFFNTWFRSFC